MLESLNGVDYHVFQWFFGSTPLLILTFMMFLGSSLGKRKIVTLVTLILSIVFWFILKGLPTAIWHHMGGTGTISFYQHASFTVVLGLFTAAILLSVQTQRR